MTATQTITLSAMQTKCLVALADLSLPNGEYCLSFYPIEQATEMSRTDVRRSVRALFRKGLAAFHKGLCTEDGEFAGAGYCITVAGRIRAEQTP